MLYGKACMMNSPPWRKRMSESDEWWEAFYADEQATMEQKRRRLELAAIRAFVERVKPLINQAAEADEYGIPDIDGILDEAILMKLVEMEKETKNAEEN